MAEVSDYEYERLGYQRRLAAAKEAGDEALVERLQASIAAVNGAIRGMGGRETATRDPGEKAVRRKPAKRG